MKLVPKRKRIVPKDNPAALQDVINNVSTNVTNITQQITQGSTNNSAAIVYVIDGGGSAITTGVKGFIGVPFNCSIVAAHLMADQTGSITIDIWKDIVANYPPTDADTITGGNEPAISGGVEDGDTALIGWTTNVSKYDILGFNVDSCATITRCTIELYVTM
jgi:hypothetical protein